MDFKLLGPLRVECGDAEVSMPKAPKVRQLLALLLFYHNQIVSTDQIVDELWGEESPRQAALTVRTYVCHIRKAMGEPGGGHGLRTVSSGYLLSLGTGQLDVSRFSSFYHSGRAHYEAGEHEKASESFRRALEVFRGRVLADVETGAILRPFKARLEEERTAAQALRIQTDLALGRYLQLIGELRSLTISQPLNEWAHARLMEALTHSGRRSDALNVYRTLRRTLDQELGIAPAPELQRLLQRILAIGQPT
ncbi:MULTISPECIES: AfsR/SARP family transcriptional regulator [Amycolatopsis]|uniref:AfsR/SARP family transcriptional regulator n=1 Tax=Amycolatopsis dendrobii TaxID=2760662 RepID=A0A7W3W405_9PSEU|nr:MULTISPECIES: AfsR/SARP family transcriptional regulator [Amycolatopsis]MBB1158453.1 AfsR/SARP family transcriptional regulator [Amycolatopsis dendrobii]UKD56958.1 AfsR/SARP family transcriptional regulator [Amycolatopsis sp. FU40]